MQDVAVRCFDAIGGLDLMSAPPRRYRFERTMGGTILAGGETDLDFVDVQTGRPPAIPKSTDRAFAPSEDDPDDVSVKGA